MQTQPIISSQKERIQTAGITVESIPGLHRFEACSPDQIGLLLKQNTKPSYTHDEIYNTYCNVCWHIECPIEEAFTYAANIYSLEEWTYSVRNLRQTDQAGLYLGLDVLAPNTIIYMRCEAYPDSKVVDYLCAWDQKEELWMRYHLRFLDAMAVIQKPGTIATWLNCKHPYYDKTQPAEANYIQQSQQRTDRTWVGDFWNFFPAGHIMEANNLKHILEKRFQQTKLHKHDTKTHANVK